MVLSLTAWLIALASWMSGGIAPLSPKKPEPIHVTGRTMGTTYHITYFDRRGRNFQQQIDTLLVAVNRSISNYDPMSMVSQFNRSPRGIGMSRSASDKVRYFIEPLRVATDIHHASDGTLDLTIMPLVNAWGFGPAGPLEMTKERVDSLKRFVGFDKIRIRADSVVKLHPLTQLDFGGIGQGYGADVVAGFLRKQGINDFLVEIGGEGTVAGCNLQTNRPWRIGILDPASTQDNQFFKAYITLKEGGFTTAGSYFNYREIDGKRYSHTIDPVTGYPAEHNLLSVSVFAENCTLADAWDTAFMVMGYEKTVDALRRHPELQALLLYTADDGVLASYATPGLAASVVFED